ncbi:hypothetical protein SDC9_134777 [bioreactor metagenome]|uniref:Uncharacterized protein n=1 Tax=bioreactor metagenome TaxID=1076179 RepID=A0A645DEI6_9ZZZZ
MALTMSTLIQVIHKELKERIKAKGITGRIA